MRVAADYARVMGEHDTIKHGIGGSLPRRVSAAGYDWGYAAENLAASFSTIEEAMQGWKNSPGHRKNLLSPYATEIGIAAVATPAGSDHRNYWALVLATPQPDRLVAAHRPRGAAMSAAALFEAARAAMRHAHAPYSKFPVGAAILTGSGKVYSGANIENASYPEGWCAETSAIAHMVMAGETNIAAVAVIAEKMPRITPCGGCRQRLREFGSADTLVHLCDASGVVETVTLGDLLPKSFSFEAKG